ncbi:MAG: hypothetical protein ACT4OO_03625 [Nitrospiraceae bacterium]
MNAVTLFLYLVLQGNPTCLAQQPNDQMFEGQAYRIEVFDCFWRQPQAPSHTFHVWSPICPRYVGQPILLSEENLQKGWAMNQFGEFYPATVNIGMMKVYHPPCE